MMLTNEQLEEVDQQIEAITELCLMDISDELRDALNEEYTTLCEVLEESIAETEKYEKRSHLRLVG